jgi:S1-C subfamily serine protease
MCTIRGLSSASLVGVLLGLLAGSAGAADEVVSADVYRQALVGTVLLQARAGQRHIQATGLLIDRERRLVLTTAHDLEEIRTVAVQFPRHEKGTLVTAPVSYQQRTQAGKAIQGKVIARDLKRDSALVQLESLPEEARALSLARTSPTPRVPLLAIGNPPLRNVMWYRLPAICRSVDDQTLHYPNGREIVAKILQADLEEEPARGCSGGPVINTSGAVVGMIAAGKEPGSTTILCIEAATLRRFVEESVARLDSTSGKERVAP